MEDKIDGFIEWLHAQLEERGWSYGELARRAGISRSSISMISSGAASPGEKFCRAVARALHIPPEEVFRRAGLLPPLPQTEKKKQSVWLRFARLTPEQQDLILATMEAWARENQPQASPGLEESKA